MRESTRFESELADLDVTGEFETKTKKAKAVTPPKPTLAALVRVRCENDHKIPKAVDKKQPVDSWLRRLYVIWAAIGSSGVAAGPFQLGRTDDDGWLRALASAATPDPMQVQPLADGVSFLFYFVRHPDEKVAEKIRSDVSGSTAHSWGSPHTITVKLEKVDRKDTLVLRVPERPDAFKPAGSKLYEEWVLFRGMPGSGRVVSGKSLTPPKRTFMQCPPLEKHVRRLQHHLGKFRYWVGNHSHPYSPHTKRDAFFNDGYFDVATWNSVLAFQRDADGGNAKVLDSSLTRVAIIDTTSYDPLPAATKLETQQLDAPKYISSQSAASSQAKPSGAMDFTVVDVVCGDTIQRWLDTDLRKPGPVVVFDSGTRTWVHEGTLAPLQAWSAELKQLGFPQGVKVSNVLRDPRIGTSTGGGMIANSIHKSGFALDLSMNWSTGKVVGTVTSDGTKIQDAAGEYPLFYEKDTSATGTRTSWKVWARIDPAKIREPGQLQTDASGNPTGFTVTDPAKTYVEYVQSITPFVYDPRDDAGGSPGAALTIPGKLFLNVTKIALHHGFIRIPAHAKGWQRIAPPATLSIAAAKLADMVKRLDLHRGDVKGVKQRLAANDEFKVNGATFKFASSGDTIGQWVEWMALAKGLSPSPEVTLHATRTAAEKKFLKKLGASKVLAGLTVTALDLATGLATAIVVAKSMVVPAGDVTLQLTTIPFTLVNGQNIEFPSRIGDPGHLEWWHHQLKSGYSGKKWAALLAEMGWTKEGLLRKEDQPGIYGWAGIGLKTADVESNAN